MRADQGRIEPGPAATTDAAPSKADTQSTTPSTPAAARGARPSRPDAHGHEDHAHEHGAERPRQANAKSSLAAQEDTHGHSKDAHGHDDEEKVVHLSAARAQQLGIEVAVARAGSVRTSLTLPGTIALNTDRRAPAIQPVRRTCPSVAGAASDRWRRHAFSTCFRGRRRTRDRRCGGRRNTTRAHI